MRWLGAICLGPGPVAGREQAIARKDAPGAIRRSQEALELAAKACLRYLGVEYPKEHDVGDALESIGEKLPEGLKAKLPEFKELLSRLAEVRGPSMYGFEKEGIPPERAFSLEFASEVFSKVRELFRLCEEFVGKQEI